MRKLCSTKGMSRDKWLSVRRCGIGGSDIGAILGMSQYASPVSVYLQKISNTVTEENEAMYFGTALESFVADEFLRRMNGEEGKKYCAAPGKWKSNKVNYVLQHDKHDWMLANLDRIITLPDGTKAILECKTANSFAKGWEGDGIPDPYWCQVQWYMGITGITRTFIAVLIGGQKFLIREVLFDATSFDTMVQKGYEFWKLVESRTPPALDGSDSGDELLQALYRNPGPDTIPLPSMASVMIQQYQEASEELKKWEEKKAFARQHLSNMLGNNVRGESDEWYVNWKPVETGRIDSKTLRKDHPSLAAAYTKTSTSRTFTLSSKLVDK